MNAPTIDDLLRRAIEARALYTAFTLNPRTHAIIAREYAADLRRPPGLPTSPDYIGPARVLYVARQQQPALLWTDKEALNAYLREMGQPEDARP